jgi:1-acyl-sn-glycerol-3-phosphate acyltransferase
MSTYHSVVWLCRSIAKVLFQFQLLHRERMIETGPVILAMNHQSYLDPPLVGSVSDRIIFSLARKSLLDHCLWRWLLPKLNVIPVDQNGHAYGALRHVIRLLRKGEAALIFPEGRRTADGNLQAPQPGLGFVIAKTLAPVVPMRIFGAHEAWPSGSKRISLHPITIVIGHPIFFRKNDIRGNDRQTYQQLSNRVMEEISKLTIS